MSSLHFSLPWIKSALQHCRSNWHLASSLRQLASLTTELADRFANSSLYFVSLLTRNCNALFAHFSKSFVSDATLASKVTISSSAFSNFTPCSFNLSDFNWLFFKQLSKGATFLLTTASLPLTRISSVLCFWRLRPFLNRSVFKDFNSVSCLSYFSMLFRCFSSQTSTSYYKIISLFSEAASKAVRLLISCVWFYCFWMLFIFQARNSSSSFACLIINALSLAFLILSCS